MMTTAAEQLKSQTPDLGFVTPIPVDSHPRYTPYNVTFSQTTITLPKGHAKAEGRKQMQVDTLLERDTAIPLRDGLHLYADIFRPCPPQGDTYGEQENVPAVICYSPYGKSSISLDNMWHRSGVPLSWTSGYETFEGLDPAEWCARGYAVVNVDARGAQFSEGTYFFWGTQEAEDVYDVIDFLARQAWCNGSVCMGGNSYLAKAQVNFASRLEHPALKALAPWEGFTDIYRQLVRRGGIAMNNTFMDRYQWGIAGTHEVEDMASMVRSHPLFDAYWADKKDDVSKIDVPLYVLGSFNNPFHVQGSFDTFRHAKTDKKWMRVHSSFEWYEMYERNSVNDLQRFFDRFAKGRMNGWESDTPRLRLSLYGVGSIPNVVERPEKEFPLARQTLRKLYLDAGRGDLVGKRPDVESSTSHEAHGMDTSPSEFTIKFDEYTEIAGYPKVRLWMSNPTHDDMNVVVHLRKISNTGRPLSTINFPAPIPASSAPLAETAQTFGPQGFLRASLAASYSHSSPDGQEVFYSYDKVEKVEPGKKVPLDITLWPMGMVFGKGEGLVLRIGGRFLSEASVGALKPTVAEDENVGRHWVHTGGVYDSCLVLPVVGGERV